MKFRKKPVVIEAVKWTGENLRDVIRFTGLHPSANKWTWEEYEDVVSKDGLKIFTVNASALSKETIGREIPNTPMMGALLKASGILDFKEMLQDTKGKLEKKFKTKPEVVAGNLKAIERAYNEVKS